jgi:hypothetical protein
MPPGRLPHLNPSRKELSHQPGRRLASPFLIGQTPATVGDDKVREQGLVRLFFLREVDPAQNDGLEPALGVGRVF